MVLVFIKKAQFFTVQKCWILNNNKNIPKDGKQKKILTKNILRKKT